MVNGDPPPLAIDGAPVVVEQEFVPNPNTGLPILAEVDDNSNMHAQLLHLSWRTLTRRKIIMWICSSTFDHEDEAQLSFDSTKKRRLEVGDESSSSYTCF